MSPPPIYTHACKLFNAFMEASIQADESLASDLDVRVNDRLFIGHWSTQFAKADGLPGESTQQKAYAWLQNAGCLEVLRRGGRDYPGIILLVRPPAPEDAKDTSDASVRAGKLGVVEAAVRAHTTRITSLEDNVTDLNGQVGALTRDVELQLRKLSARMDEALAAREGREAG